MSHLAKVTECRTFLLEWLDFLGLEARPLSRALGLADSTIATAAMRGSRRLPWLPGLERLVGVPPGVLLDVDPTSPAAREWRGKAAVRAAHFRAKNRRDA